MTQRRADKQRSRKEYRWNTKELAYRSGVNFVPLGVDASVQRIEGLCLRLEHCALPPDFYEVLARNLQPPCNLLCVVFGTSG